MNQFTPPANFQAFSAGLKIMGLKENEIDDLYKILAGLMHLFEFKFVEGDNGQGVKICPKCEAKKHVEYAAKLLGMGENDLKTALVKRTVVRQKRNSRDAGEVGVIYFFTLLLRVI